MKSQRLPLLLVLPFIATGAAFSASFLGGFSINLPNSFAAGQPARASEVNANFDTIVTAVETRADDVDAQIDTVVLDLDALTLRTQDLETLVAGVASPENVLVVSPSGAAFTSVAAALASINDASETNPYVVYVAPGVYEETELCEVQSFVTLLGAGPAASIVRSSRTGNSQGAASSTVLLSDNGAIADIRIENVGAAALSNAISGFGLSRATRITNVVARADGNGGTGHFAILASDGDVTIIDSVLFASGASTVNTAFACADSSGPFSQPLLRGCDLEGDGAQNGIGIQISNTAISVEQCRVQGDSRGISAAISGISTIRDSRIETSGFNPVYEQTGSATILSGGVFFVGGNAVGGQTQFKYAHCIKSNFDVVINGFGSTVQP